MAFSICVIDDKIPASAVAGIIDYDLLNRSVLQMILQQDAAWTDPVIKNLIKTLLEQKDAANDKWKVYGYTHPSFFINGLDSDLARFDIIVYDWEYPGTGTGGGVDSETILLEILEKTFCLVFVFSGADKDAEIQVVLNKPTFQLYKERLQLLDKTKDGVDQTDTLLAAAESKYASNFSFRFASALRRHAIAGADAVLSELGKASLNDIRIHIAATHNGKRDFVDFLTERFRSALATKTIHDFVQPGQDLLPDDTTIDDQVIQNIWSFRLYARKSDTEDIVRRGDIVSHGGRYYLVITADCDLERFWHKNFGIINSIGLYELSSSNTELKTLLTCCADLQELVAGNFSSLIANVGGLPEGPFILPFIPFGGTYKSLVAVPKDFTSIKVSVPNGWSDREPRAKKNQHLTYSLWSGAEKQCSLSEPFRTPVIQHVLGTLAGYGVPDYSEKTKEIIKGALRNFTQGTA